MNTQPIFIFSIPRSGSTLLQRLLAGHPEIETKSEMWFLLPFVYTLKESGIYAEYNSESLNKAINYLLSQLPNGKKDYFDALRLFADTIYSKLNHNNAIYFLDKTPRYYLIINEIEKIFPDGKFIFLFRHPLSNLSSFIENFNRGNIGNLRHKIDIYKGPGMLASGYNAIKNKSIYIQYESLLDHPQKVIRYVCDYLSINYYDSLIDNFNKIPVTVMGDQFGSKKFQKIEIGRKEKWKSVLATRYRKKYALKYIKYLGEETIKTFGYDMDNIKIEVDKLIPTSSNSAFSDIFHELICNIKSFIEFPMLKKKFKVTRKRNEKYYIHY